MTHHRVYHTTNDMIRMLSSDDLSARDHQVVFSIYQAALRADSSGAPENHTQAAAAGQEWLDGEAKELGNHFSTQRILETHPTL